MNKETESQREMREHYEKIYNQALKSGPRTLEDCEEMKDWYSWQWGQIDHVVTAMGGFANFRHFILKEAFARFKTIETLQNEIAEARKGLGNISSNFSDKREMAYQTLKRMDDIKDVPRGTSDSTELKPEACKL